MSGRLGKLREVFRKLTDDEITALDDVLSGSGESIVGDAELGKVDIAKVDEDRQTVFGWANVAAVRKDDGTDEVLVDREGDEIDFAELEDAAYIFNLMFREGDEMHGADAKASLIESFVPTDDKLLALAKIDGPDKPADPDVLKALHKAFPKGWWTGFYIPDHDVFAKCLPGPNGEAPEYAMFSIGGLGVRKKVDA